MTLTLLRLISLIRNSFRLRSDLALENLALRQQLVILKRRGAPRVHGELLKLGIDISERTVSSWMPKRREAPSQTWRTFLSNHVGELVSIDFFTVLRQNLDRIEAIDITESGVETLRS